MPAVTKADYSPKLGQIEARAALVDLQANQDLWVAQMDTGYTPHRCFQEPGGAVPANLLAAHGSDLLETAKPDGRDPLRREEAFDYPGHGTRTLSVMVGNHPRLKGAIPGCRVVPFRVTSSPIFKLRPERTKPLGAAILRALEEPRIRVISISLGLPLRPDPSVAQAIDAAYERGVIVVAACGQIIQRVTWPGRYFRTIGAGGVTRSHTVYTAYEGSDVRLFVDSFAFAVNVFRANSVLKNGAEDYIFSGEAGDEPPPYDGTSYAAAQVAGAAALWLQRHGAALEATFGARDYRLVESFRASLQATGYKVQKQAYNRRILHVEQLLRFKPRTSGLTPRPAAVLD